MTEETKSDNDHENPILSPDDARKWVDDLLIEQQNDHEDSRLVDK